MIFELMSNGTLAKLPQTPILEGFTPPGGPFVMLLLPHNRYLLGTPAAGTNDRWVWGKPGGELREVSLYENETLPLLQDETASISIPGDAVTFLKRELLAQLEPPGNHLSTVLILRGFMKEHMAFSDGFPFQDEAAFAHCLSDDDTLRKTYWTLRFALARGEFDVLTRLKAWNKAGPELFSEPDNGMKVWFSILDLPSEENLQELEALAFSREDLRHMVSQHITPLLLFNPRSGYLILYRFNKKSSGTGFLIWAFLPPTLWGELRERRKLPVREVLLAMWGQHDIDQALEERSRYAGGRWDALSLSQV